MGICDQANQTLATLNLRIKELLAIENENKLIGIAGDALDRLFVRTDRRKCKIIGDTILGEKLENGTFTGNLGLLQNGLAHIYIKLESPIVAESWLKLSLPILTENFVILQTIDTDKFEQYNLLNSLNLGLTSILSFFSAILFSFLFALFVIYVTYRIYERKNFTESKFKFKKLGLVRMKARKSFSYTFSALAVFLVFYKLYIWLLTILLTNNVSTSATIIDTSSIISDNNLAFRTSRTFCTVKDDTEEKIIKLSSKEHVLRRLFEEKSLVTKPIRGLEGMRNCVVEKSEKSSIIDIDKIYTVIAEQSAYVVAFFLANVKSNITGFMNLNNPFFKSNLYVYHVMDDDYVYQILLPYIEHGLFVNLVANLQRNSMQYVRKENRIFFTLKAYINEMTKFDNLHFDNFEQIFRIHFLFCGLILVAFLIHWLINLFERFSKKRNPLQPRKKRKKKVVASKMFLENPDLSDVDELPVYIIPE